MTPAKKSQSDLDQPTTSYHEEQEGEEEEEEEEDDDEEEDTSESSSSEETDTTCTSSLFDEQRQQPQSLDDSGYKQRLRPRQGGHAITSSLKKNLLETSITKTVASTRQRNHSKSSSSSSANSSFASPSSTKRTRSIIVYASIIISVILASYIVAKLSVFKPIHFVKFNDLLPNNPPAHKWYHIESFFVADTLQRFRDIAFGGETLSSIVAEGGGGGGVIESAGEARPVGHPDCRHPFMTLNLNRTLCHFANRLDVGQHFVRTGGFNGHMEFYDRMVARIIPLRKRLLQPVNSNSQAQYSFATSSYEELKTLAEFHAPEFVHKVKSICMDNAEFRNNAGFSNVNAIVNELFQLDLLLMLPGQELPMHLNVPYFFGADRYNFPQWLLVAMKNSMLFDHLFIPQVQGIAWISEHGDGNTEFVDHINGVGGNFYLYPYLPILKEQSKKLEETKTATTTTTVNQQQDAAYEQDESLAVDEEGDYKFLAHNDSFSYKNVNKFVIVPSKLNSVVLADGTQVIHGVDRFKPRHVPPLSSMATGNNHYTIRFDKELKSWLLYDFQDTLLKSYEKNEVKLSVVWNMHCFVNEKQRALFHSQLNDARHPSRLTLEQVMETFKADLKKKNRLPSDQIEPIDLWTIVLKYYLRYPKNSNNPEDYFGINYCLLPNIMPRWITENLLNPILKDKC